jgi:hypothetical protein
MNFWEVFILNAVVGVLHGFRINPASIPAVKGILVTIITVACELLGVQPPTIP